MDGAHGAIVEGERTIKPLAVTERTLIRGLVGDLANTFRADQPKGTQAPSISQT